MRAPVAPARAELDNYIRILAQLSDDVTIDDFRAASIAAAKRTERHVRFYVMSGGTVFLVIALGVLLSQALLGGAPPWATVISAAVWSFALGGIGAIANIFVHLLKLMPQQSLNTADEFDVIARIVLGCLFSTIISITLVPDIFTFFADLERLNTVTKLASGPLALLPFLLGYSIPLALRILEKIIMAVEISIGAEDRRVPSLRAPRKRRR